MGVTQSSLLLCVCMPWSWMVHSIPKWKRVQLFCAFKFKWPTNCRLLIAVCRYNVQWPIHCIEPNTMITCNFNCSISKYTMRCVMFQFIEQSLSTINGQSNIILMFVMFFYIILFFIRSLLYSNFVFSFVGPFRVIFGSMVGFMCILVLSPITMWKPQFGPEMKYPSCVNKSAYISKNNLKKI